MVLFDKIFKSSKLQTTDAVDAVVKICIYCSELLLEKDQRSKGEIGRAHV